MFVAVRINTYRHVNAVDLDHQQPEAGKITRHPSVLAARVSRAARSSHIVFQHLDKCLIARADMPASPLKVVSAAAPKCIL
jgi:hypothetical protein